MWWQIYAVTRIGIVVKSFQNDAWSTTSGNNEGTFMVPSNNFTIATPAVIATNTIAKPTDNADVYLSESRKSRTKRKGQLEHLNNYLDVQ